MAILRLHSFPSAHRFHWRIVAQRGVNRRRHSAEVTGRGCRKNEEVFFFHSVLGPGLLESAYSACLKFELEIGGISVRFANLDFQFVYKGVKLESDTGMICWSRIL